MPSALKLKVSIPASVTCHHRASPACCRSEHEEMRAKCVAAAKVHTALEARLRCLVDQLHAATERNTAALKAEAGAFYMRSASRLAMFEAGKALAGTQLESAAVANEIVQLRAERRAMLSVHVAELGQAHAAKESALADAVERVNACTECKDEAIRELQAQVTALQNELNVVRQQLCPIYEELFETSPV